MSADSERGFTVVELLIGLVITAILAIAVARVIGVTSEALTTSGDRVVVATQAVRFTTLLKYDMSGASDVFIFDSTVPANTAHLCSDWNSSAASWTDANNVQFVRELFAIQVPSLAPPPTPGPLPGFLPLNTQLVGYEIRRQSTGAYDIHRVVCASDPVLQWRVVQTQRVLSLGKTLRPDVDGIASLRCFDVAGAQLNVAAGQSTLTASPRCASFDFIPPVTSRALLQSLGDASLQRLSSVVTA